MPLLSLQEKIFERLEDKVVMLVGAGEMSELAARHLTSNGVRNFIVSNKDISEGDKARKGV